MSFRKRPRSVQFIEYCFWVSSNVGLYTVMYCLFVMHLYYGTLMFVIILYVVEIVNDEKRGGRLLLIVVKA